jgi:hypothetical protein
MAGGGRDQLGPIARLVRILVVLESAGLAGAGQQQLLDVARYGGGADDQRRALNRELRHLTDAGWDIRNVGDVGGDARYMLRARDIRLRVSLTREQQADSRVPQRWPGSRTLPSSSVIPRTSTPRAQASAPLY